MVNPRAKIQTKRYRRASTAWLPLRLFSNLALDAPCVALSWWYLLAVSVPGKANWLIGVALFFAVWAIYLFDRIVDRGLNLPNQPERKKFADKHTLLLRILLALAILTSVSCGLFLSVDIWWQASLIGVITITYFVLCRTLRCRLKIPLKESLIGICFAAGVGLPYTFASPIIYWVYLASFATLCTLNCLVISKAESDYDQNDDSTAWFATRENQNKSLNSLWILLIALLIIQIASLPSNATITATFLAATIALWILDRNSIRLNKQSQTLADACLWFPAAIGILISSL